MMKCFSLGARSFVWGAGVLLLPLGLMVVGCGETGPGAEATGTGGDGSREVTASGGDGGGNASGGGGGTTVTPATVGFWDNPETDVTGTPPLLVDLNVSGRTEFEVNEIGYRPWVIEDGASREFDGIHFAFSGEMESTYHKASVQEPYYYRLAGDGIRGGQSLKLTISGLSSGSHTLLSYHNHIDNPENNQFQPIDVKVNGQTQVSALVPSARLSNEEAATSFIRFEGSSVEIEFSSAGFVFLNGFALDVPDAQKQARNPSPEQADEHVDADNGKTTLRWEAAPGAVSHNIYIGTNRDVVQFGNETHSAYRGNQTGTSFEMEHLYSLYTYYWRVDEVDAEGNITPGKLWYFRPRQLAFPGAEGYGRFARGGRGGQVVYVSNLNDSGPGSLREALTAEIGPRTVLFSVSGTIQLQSRLVASQRYVTLAGQSAPGKGICVRSAPLGITGGDQIVQNMRVRLGAGTTYDGMGMTGAEHSIIDSSSISWTIDEAFSSRNARNITLQRTLISECLNDADHEVQGGRHGYAGSISGDVGSFHHNLLAHCAGRNWSMAGGLDGDGFYKGRLDLFNNVVYNWDNRTTDGGAHEVNFVANYYKPGPATSIFTALNPTYDGFPGTQQYFMAGNVMPGHFDESDQMEGTNPGGVNGGVPPYDLFVTEPFFESFAQVDSAKDAYKKVLSNVGANQPQLDEHDQRIVRETLEGSTTYEGSRTGLDGHIDHQNDAGGYENYPAETRAADWDSDSDGLPDFWERMLGSATDSAAGDFSDANADPDLNGFTALDEYLQWLSEPHYFVETGEVVELDLAELFVGFEEEPTYAITSGEATLNDSRVSLSAEECGVHTFELEVQDAEGSRMKRRVGLFVAGCE